MHALNSNIPFIHIPDMNADFLIDTGSTKILINPKLAYNYYQNCIYNENFNIQTAHNISHHDEISEIPIFLKFTVKDHKLYLFEFGKNYDRLNELDHV